MNLEKAITDYLLQMIENRYAQSTFRRYEQVLNHFQSFINARQIFWQDVFIFDTLQSFEKQSGLRHARAPVRGLSRYLFAKNKIHRPIEKPIQTLPQIYEQYRV